MAVQYAFSQITTTGLKLAVDAADPLSYPGSGTSWTDVTGNGFTGTVSSSISFATTFRGALVSSNSSSAISFSGSAANFGTGSFTIEMAFSPSVINGRHWLYSKNSGSFPNFGAFVTGSGGSGRITAFYNISSTISSSATTAIGSIVTGSNYIVDVTYVPSDLFTGVYLNSNLLASGLSNGVGSLATSASLLLLNNTTSSNSGTVGNLYNFKVYNPLINSSNIRKNYNSMCSRFGLPLALYTPPAPFLLNVYPGAAAAYSLRLLNSTYSGAAIQVRRSSDNTVLDIGFDINGNLNTGALLAFCGASDGFVTEWYDQSGNGRNASQGTALSQPTIVSAGSVFLENSKPIIKAGNNTQFLVINNSIPRASITSIFYAMSADTSNALFSAFADGANVAFMILHLDSIVTAVNINVGTPTVFRNSSLYTVTTRGAAYNDFQGQKLLTLIGGSTNSLVPFNIGYGAGIKMYNSQEIIIYNSDQSSNRTAIESNINSYYSIY
jgi:hypothetical protein